MLRPYRESDVEALAFLFTDSVHGLASTHYDQIQLNTWAPRPPDLSAWMVRLAALDTLVAEVAAEPAGFISYEKSGHIDLLYTSPAHSRHGIASALYLRAEKILVSDGVEELFTDASLVARPFFERRGFHVTEEQRVELRGVAFRRFGMRKSLSYRFA